MSIKKPKDKKNLLWCLEDIYTNFSQCLSVWTCTKLLRTFLNQA